MNERTHGTDRGRLSPEAVAALGFGLTVLVIAVTGGALMQTGEELEDAGPILSVSASPIDATDQWVRLTHDGGDTVDLAAIDLTVGFSDHPKRARLHGLPTNGISQSDYEGNHVFTLGGDGVGGVAAEMGDDGRWDAGETIDVRIEDSRVDLEPDETVTVTVQHAETDTRLAEHTLEVVD